MKKLIILCMLLATGACTPEIESYENEYNKPDHCSLCDQPLQNNHIH